MNAMNRSIILNMQRKIIENAKKKTFNHEQNIPVP
jgi:hypothetical protein